MFNTKGTVCAKAQRPDTGYWVLATCQTLRNALRLHPSNPCSDLVRLGKSLSSFTDEETDLRGQIRCLETQLVSMGQQSCYGMWLCAEPRESELK